MVQVGGGTVGAARAILAALIATAAAGGVLAGLRDETAAVPTCVQAGPYAPPAPDSVGVPDDLPLCRVSALTVSAPGAVLDGLDVAGGIVVEARDVVVRRSRVTGDGTLPAGIRTVDGGSVRIEDTTVTGDFTEAGVEGADWTAERVELVGLRGDPDLTGARLGPGVTLRNSWLHDLAGSGDALALVAPAGDVLVEGNRIERGPGGGSAVVVEPPPSRRAERPGAVVIRGNELGGGDYTLRLGGTSDSLSELRITGNRFRRDAAVGPLRVPGAVDLADNLFVDGGLLGRGRG
ncbi:hypothetical protein [Pseudonocardia sp. T1-2H]|uniref:hypothetical protein n=1 Tax=Pseudonocardia sp. T1-2H TaxID=3128899 RepID=UPI0031011176